MTEIKFELIARDEYLLRCPKCLALVERGNAKGHNGWHKNNDERIRVLETKIAALGAPGKRDTLGDLLRGI